VTQRSLLLERLPDWPPVLHEAWAAAYLSLSLSTFRKTVVPEVPAVKLTVRRVGWLRADLDNWLARKAGHPANDEVKEPDGSEWLAALKQPPAGGR